MPRVQGQLGLYSKFQASQERDENSRVASVHTQGGNPCELTDSPGRVGREGDQPKPRETSQGGLRPLVTNLSALTKSAKVQL